MRLRAPCWLAFLVATAGVALGQELARAEHPFAGLEPAQPHLAVSSDGTVFLVCIAGVEERDVWLVVSGKGGGFRAPVKAIDVAGRATGGLQRGPRVGVDRAGRVFVSVAMQLEDWEPDQKYPRGDVWLAVSRDGGETFAPPLRVNDRVGAAEHPEAEKSAKEGMHWMSVTPEGEAHLVWLDHRLAPEKGQLLAYAKVSGGGREVGPNVLAYVPPETICQCCTPAIDVDGRGNPVLAFRNAVGDGREIWTVTSDDGGRSFGPAARLSAAPSGIPG